MIMKLLLLLICVLMCVAVWTDHITVVLMAVCIIFFIFSCLNFGLLQKNKEKTAGK